MIILPIQARDKHRENSKKPVFSKDLLGVPARRIDNASKIGPGTVLASPVQEHGANGGANGGANAARLGARLSSNMALMTVEECGGEPEDQKWAFGAPAAGFISNNATQSCINIARGKETRLSRCHSVRKMIILPRQARDKHGENSQKDGFLQTFPILATR
jgi:hypothetical protein